MLVKYVKRWVRLVSLLVLMGVYSLLPLVQAQTQCLDDTTFAAQKPALDSLYKPIRDVFDPDYYARKRSGVTFYSEMARSERLVHRTQSDFNQRFDQHLLSLGLLLGKLKGVEVRAYMNPSGSLDYVNCTLDRASLNEFDRATVEQSLCTFFSGYKATLIGGAPYRLYLSFLLTGSTPTDKRAQLTRFISQTKAEKGVIRTIADLATTQPDTVTAVTLEKLDLTEVPRSLSRFKNLERLNLSDNELAHVPRFVFRLPNLSTLDLSGNRLTSSSVRYRRNHHLKRINLQFNQLHQLPRQMPRNRQLENLWLGYNDLSAGISPRALRRLKNLVDLNLYRAHLRQLPSTIGRLKRLKTLDLYYNQLHELPATIGANQALQQLALSYNQLGKLPETISQLSQLQELYVRGNSLTDLPVSLGTLRSLQTLDLSRNAFDELPASVVSLSVSSLQELNVSENQLRSLPIQLLGLGRLRRLHIGGNPATEKEKIAGLLPLIHQLKARQTTVYY